MILVCYLSLIDFADASHIMLFAVATIAFAIALISYSRFRSKKVLLLTIGFGLFFVNGLIAIPEVIYTAYNVDLIEDVHLLIEASAILFLIVGTLTG